MKHVLTFDEGAHAYTIDSRPVPSVTQVLRDVLPMFHAEEYYLQRGRAVHAHVDAPGSEAKAGVRAARAIRGLGT